MNEAFLSLGTNLGNKVENLKQAIRSINLLCKTKIIKVSKIYVTKPFEVPDVQDNHLNCCVKVATELDPHIFLGCCLGIEAAMGRIRKFKFCSRIIDIDLLIYENLNIFNEHLIIPHPQIKKRSFVLKPLSDICKNNKFKNFDFNHEMHSLDFSDVVITNFNI